MKTLYRFKPTSRKPIVLLGTFVLFAGLLVSGIILYTNSRETHAADTASFNPGYIISDSVFYNPSAMSVSDIQNFLNQKVTSCDTNGTQPYSGSTTRAAYSASRGYSPPFVCLKDYSATTSQEPADAYCAGYNTASQTSAQIIYGVAQSCGINPQVLLVLLQKEQGLITDTWPWTSQYQKATGFACPDNSGCDTSYYGLFNQLYFAARQFKIYQAKPSSYSYVANRNNNILYNPSSSCGSSSIYITNQATAGLYNYTPYQPNAASLAAGYGTGDSCSSYGNRNFWLYFSDWFGSPTNAPSSNLLLQNGTYEFTNPTSGKSLDVSGGSTADGASVQLYTTNHSNAQRWTITQTSDGYYTFMNLNSGKYLDVANASMLSGAKLQIYSGNNSCAQQWSIRSIGANATLLNKCSNLAVDITGGAMDDGTKIQSYSINNSPSQTWSAITTATSSFKEGFYTLASSGGLVLDIQNGSTTSGAATQIYTANSSEAQNWQIKQLPDGLFVLRNPNSNKYLTVANSSASSVIPVQISDFTGACSQQWLLTNTSASAYTLKSACSGLVVDIPGGAVSTAGTTLQTYASNGSAAQQWTLSPLTTGVIPSGTYSVTSGAKTAFDITGGSPNDGTRIQVYTPNATTSQLWQFVHIAGNVYSIYNANTNKYVDLAGGNTSAGSTIQLYTGNNTCSQQWKVTQPTANTYTFLSNCSNQSYAIDVTNGYISTPGSKTQLYTSNNSSAQIWSLTIPGL